jgi:hypothetical protein
MKRAFSRDVRRQTWRRCDGHCEGCDAALTTGHIVYDHAVPWEISRDSSLGNCQVLCTTCDRAKTYGIDLPLIAQVDRVHDRHIGALRQGEGRRPMPCGRRSRWSKPVDGFRPVTRVSQAQRHRAMMARRFGEGVQP